MHFVDFLFEVAGWRDDWRQLPRDYDIVADPNRRWNDVLEKFNKLNRGRGLLDI